MKSLKIILEKKIRVLDYIFKSCPFSLNEDDYFFLQTFKVNDQIFKNIKQYSDEIPLSRTSLFSLEVSIGLILKKYLSDEKNKKLNVIPKSISNNSLKFNGCNNEKVNINLNETCIEKSFKTLDCYESKKRDSLIIFLYPFEVNFLESLSITLRNFYLINKKKINSNSENNFFKKKEYENLNSNSSKVHDSSFSDDDMNQIKNSIFENKLCLDLDFLYIYKILLKMILDMFKILKNKFMFYNQDITVNLDQKLNNGNDDVSIFSISRNDEKNTLISIPVDIYTVFLSKIINVISELLLDPFIKLVFFEVIKTNFQENILKIIDN